MINKFKKKIALIISISLILLTGCASKNSTTSEVINIEKSQNSKPVNETKAENTQNTFAKYLNLLGLNKEKLISTLNEKANSTGEGGLEFKEAGIRVWFDEKSYTFVNQIFIMKKDVDLNGVKTDDKISKFKEVFGNPISDRNGDAHFKYKNIFLSVNYDTNTGQAYGVYILKNDF